MSLIQQRMATDRQRIWSGVLYSVFFTVDAVTGAMRLVDARRRRLVFESEHGSAAGKQDPVR